MTHAPALATLAWLAHKRVVMAGDFWQLPAIHPPLSMWPVTERPAAERWIARDIFALHGLTPEMHRPSPAIIMLREQHRMARPICDLVNVLAYGAHEDLITRVSPSAPLWPNAEARLVLVDTAALNPEATSLYGSWTNRRHQQVIHRVVALLRQHDPEATIGIVTPFRMQARQLAEAWRGDACVMAATVHRFQGSEREIMILDPVRLTPRHHEFNGDTVMARRLWNVALSRARKQVILIAPGIWTGTTVPERLVRYLQQYGTIIDARHLLTPSSQGMTEHEGVALDKKGDRPDYDRDDRLLADDGRRSGGPRR